jgi:hypothetical protein
MPSLWQEELGQGSGRQAVVTYPKAILRYTWHRKQFIAAHL